MQDFKEFLNVLNSEKIEYLLIGGYAVWLYGFVRRTKDMDVWVSVRPDNLERLRAALVRFGFSKDTDAGPLFQAEQTVLRMGVPPNRLEVISKIAALDFEACYARRRMMDVEGIQVPVIDYDDLITNKSATGRASDRADVERLQKRRPSQ